MPRGFFTQTVCILLSRSTDLAEVEPLLGEYRISKRVDASESAELAGPTLIVPFRPEVNGYVCVDLQGQRWPDHMGDPKAEPMLFASWGMGHYGPFTYPGNLGRAAQQAWSWREGALAATDQHQAFIRVRTSYIFGAAPEAKIVPPDYEPRAELDFTTRVALALCSHSAAVAYFNPGGEVLQSPGRLLEAITFSEEQNVPPLDVWASIRLLNPNNGWMIMDTVGMDQLGLPDLEACFPKGKVAEEQIAAFLRNISLYLLTAGEVIRNGDTIDGPGGIQWRAFHVPDPLSDPPRRVLRWFPQDGSKPPSEMAPREIQIDRKGLGSRIAGWFGR